jgi:hypothetical protein
MLLTPSGNWYGLLDVYGDNGFEKRLFEDLDGEAVAEDGYATSYAFLKVLRTVGDAVGPAASDSDNPVDELPKVIGSEEV